MCQKTVEMFQPLYCLLFSRLKCQKVNSQQLKAANLILIVKISITDRKMRRVLRSSVLSSAESKENLKTIEVTPEKKHPTRKSKRKSPTPQDDEDSSPPKSPRSNSLSPLGNQFAEQLQLSTPKSSKQRSIKRALVDNVNFRLPGRETEFDELSSYINNIVATNGSGSLYISGAPGTGKTATLNKIINSDELKKKLKIVFINCTGISSIGSIYKKVCEELNLKRQGERAKDCLAAIEKHLAVQRRKMTLLVLDEIDQLCTSDAKQSILYNIFEWPAKPNSKIILIGIANSLDLTDRLLVRLKVKCELQPKVMQFTAYTKSQIVEIFKSRLEESGVSDLFPPAAIQLLAAKVSSVSGDIRRALNIGKRVAELADAERRKNVKAIDLTKFEALIETEESSDEASQPAIPQPQEESKIQLKEVVTVLKSVFGKAQDDVDESFPVQQKILICTLLLIIKNEKTKTTTVGRLHEVYKKVCKNRNILSIGLDEFLNLCTLSESRSIIKLIMKKETRFHQVQLRWDEEEVHAALKDKQMVTNIINERSLLNR